MQQPQKSKIKVLCLKSLKRTHDVFLANFNTLPEDPLSQRAKIAAKIIGEYRHVKDMPIVPIGAGPKGSVAEPPQKKQRTAEPAGQTNQTEMDVELTGPHSFPSAPGKSHSLLLIFF